MKVFRKKIGTIMLQRCRYDEAIPIGKSIFYADIHSVRGNRSRYIDDGECFDKIVDNCTGFIFGANPFSGEGMKYFTNNLSTENL